MTTKLPFREHPRLMHNTLISAVQKIDKTKGDALPVGFTLCIGQALTEMRFKIRKDLFKKS